MACWVHAQESTSSCHKSYAHAPACGGGGLIRSLLGGRPPISAKQKRSSLSSTCPCCPLSSVSSKEPPAWAEVGWRVGWGARRRVKLRLASQAGTQGQAMQTDGDRLSSSRSRDPEEVAVTGAGGMEVRYKDGLTDGSSKAGGRGGDHSRKWTPLSAGDNRGIEPGRVLGVTGQTE